MHTRRPPARDVAPPTERSSPRRYTSTARWSPTPARAPPGTISSATSGVTIQWSRHVPARTYVGSRALTSTIISSSIHSCMRPSDHEGCPPSSLTHSAGSAFRSPPTIARTRGTSRSSSASQACLASLVPRTGMYAPTCHVHSPTSPFNSTATARPRSQTSCCHSVPSVDAGRAV
eukprot:4842752-Prymnesium_polylepis.1